MLFNPKDYPYLLQESYYPFEGRDYLYFEEPVEFYSLNYYKRKLASFQQLMYVMEVLLWLNPNLDYDTFLQCALYVSDRTNGKSIRTYSENRVIEGCDRIWANKERKPYVNKYRRVIFNPSRQFDKSHKMKIVGKLCGGPKNKVTPQIVYNTIEELMAEEMFISINILAEALSVTRQTISRHLSSDMKEVMREHNQSLK
jgi:DNA-binding transcriptional ArsR family regulator